MYIYYVCRIRCHKTMKSETIRWSVIYQNDGHNSEFIILIHNVVNSCNMITILMTDWSTDHLQIRGFVLPHLNCRYICKKCTAIVKIDTILILTCGFHNFIWVQTRFQTTLTDLQHFKEKIRRLGWWWYIKLFLAIAKKEPNQLIIHHTNLTKSLLSKWVQQSIKLQTVTLKPLVVV